MAGWIRLYNKMLDWEWYGNTNVVRVFLHCLLKANYQRKVWQSNTIERGQFITSVSLMSAELGLTPKQVRNALKTLERANNVAIKRANGKANSGSVVTICNYDTYQTSIDTERQTKGQTEGQTKGNLKGNYNRNTNNTEYINTDIDKNTTPKGDSIKKPKLKGFDIIEYLKGKGVSEQYINDWLLIRNKKKGVDTLTAMERIEVEIQKAGLTWNEAVGYCIDWEWRGFKYNWYKNKMQDVKRNQPQLPMIDEAERKRMEAEIEQQRAEAGRRQAERERQEWERAERERIARLNELTGFDYQPTQQPI